MPDRLRPDLPQEVEDAVRVFGYPARVAILGYLSTHDAVTRSELAADLALIPKTAQVHLAALAELGALTTDPEAGERRRGQHTRYSLDGARLEQLYVALGRHFGLDVDQPGGGRAVKG